MNKILLTALGAKATESKAQSWVSDYRIVIADDDRLILATLGQGLREAGYVVLEATDGKEAVHLCETKKPDLAILDVLMPNISGLEAARQLRQNTETPFIFLSAHGEKDIVKLAAEEGAFGYLVKPIDIPQILPTLETALARAAEFTKLRTSILSMTAALENAREASTVVGILMERYHLTQEEAFNALRQYARAERKKLKDIAHDIFSGEDVLNALRTCYR